MVEILASLIITLAPVPVIGGVLYHAAAGSEAKVPSAQMAPLPTRLTEAPAEER